MSKNSASSTKSTKPHQGKNFSGVVTGLSRAAKRSWTVGQKLWSLKSATLITAVAALISIIQIFVAIHGKLVIIPFEVRSDQAKPKDLGESFAASLSITLNEYRSLFPSADGKRPTITGKNYSGLVQAFMSQLPFVEIPQISPLNKGATVLETIKLGEISIPFSQLIFDHLVFFHDDTLRGTLEEWGADLVARFSLGSDEEVFSVSVPKDLGYRGLLDRVAVELLQRKKWISPIPMKLSALTKFSAGLRDYLSFDAYDEDRFISSAREKYASALAEDKNADLVRLHLAASQYISTDPAILERAIENFSLLLGSPRFGRAAKIGYVASSLSYISRVGNCSGAYRYMAPMLQETRSWEQGGKLPDKIEELLLWSNALQMAADFLLPGKPCAQQVRLMLPDGDINNLFSKARSGYGEAAIKIAEPDKYSAGELTRYQFYINLNIKYLTDDAVDYSVLTKKPNLNLATAALVLGKEIEKARDQLPDDRQRFYVTSIAGSVANSYLRLAKIEEANVPDAVRLVGAAIDELHEAINSTDPLTAQWAIFQLADVELGRSNASVAMDWLVRAYAKDASFVAAFDQSYLSKGVLVERAAQRCKAISVLKRGSALGSLASKLFLIDAQMRQGDVAAAQQSFYQLRAAIESSTRWVGSAIRQKLSLIRAKLTPTLADIARLRDPISLVAEERAFLRFDGNEQGMIANDEALLTALKSQIWLPSLVQFKIADPGCLS